MARLWASVESLSVGIYLLVRGRSVDLPLRALCGLPAGTLSVSEESAGFDDIVGVAGCTNESLDDDFGLPRAVAGRSAGTESKAAVDDAVERLRFEPVFSEGRSACSLIAWISLNRSWYCQYDGIAADRREQPQFHSLYAHEASTSINLSSPTPHSPFLTSWRSTGTSHEP